MCASLQQLDNLWSPKTNNAEGASFLWSWQCPHKQAVSHVETGHNPDLMFYSIGTTPPSAHWPAPWVHMFLCPATTCKALCPRRRRDAFSVSAVHVRCSNQTLPASRCHVTITFVVLGRPAVRHIKTSTSLLSSSLFTSRCRCVVRVLFFFSFALLASFVKLFFSLRGVRGGVCCIAFN